jgi:predicted DNA-binding protein (MmcQ/YjbR family)
MNIEDVAEFCLGLPGAREDYKWGGVRVFSIAETKMFAVMGLAGNDLSFKVGPDLFRAISTVRACALPPTLRGRTGSP